MTRHSVPQAFMPEHAWLAALALIGTAALLLLLAAGAVAALRRRRRVGAAGLAGAGAAVAAVYTAVLLAISVASQEQTLNRGDRKYFCEIDCHIAYSVEGVEASTEDLGTRYLVSVATWFDPSTIASFRGGAPLTPNARVAFLLDETGRRYPAAGDSVRALSRPLRPGESRRTTLSFLVPDGARRPRLFLGDPGGVENLLIGHENSPWHRRIAFSLQPRSPERPVSRCARPPGQTLQLARPRFSRYRWW